MKVSPEQFLESYKSASEIYTSLKVKSILERVEKDLSTAVEKNKNIKTVSDKPVSSVAVIREPGEDVSDLQAAGKELEKMGFNVRVEIDSESYSSGHDYLVIVVK